MGRGYGDGKNKFYRNLNLDRQTRDILKVFRQLKRKMINESEDKPKEEEK